MDPSHACPYLGIPEDPATHFAFPSTAQRCHATLKPTRIDLAKQARDCLTAQHVECPRYHPPPASFRQAGLLRAAVAGPSVELVHPGKGRAAPTPRRARRVAWLATLVAWLTLGALMVGALAIALLDDARLATPTSSGAPGTAAPGAESPAPSPGGVVPAAPSDSAPPTETTPPIPTPTSTPSPVATSDGSSTPTPPRIPLVHVVDRGETLTSIARRYGVSVAQLKLANEIRDPNLIYKGQRVVIPVR